MSEYNENEFNVELEEDEVVEDLSTGSDKLEFVEENMDEDRYNDIQDVKSADDQLAKSIEIDKDSFTVNIGTVSIDDIVIPTPIKDSRKETYLGLTRTVQELGVLSPVHIMVLEDYAEYVEENGTEVGYEGPKYVLIDGLRRIFALKKNRIDRVNAVIYDFKDKDKGSDMLNIMSLLLNKCQRKSWGEIWYMYQVLESESSLSPNSIEYLLQLEPGDAMKLKDIMSRQMDFPEPAEDLLSNKKNLQQAYNALNKAMKEQDQLAKEDVSGVSGMEQTEGVIEKGNGLEKLSDQEVKELLDMSDSFDGELSDDDFDELMGNNIENEHQAVGERHPLDPALKAAVLARDGYCCRITGRGAGLPAPISLAILNVHHKIPVHCGGDDSMENLITVCLDAHTLIHVIERNMGKLGMSKEQFESLDETEKEFIKGVMKIARIAVEANKRQGRTREEIRKETADSVRFQMPGKVQKENMEAIAQAKLSEDNQEV